MKKQGFTTQSLHLPFPKADPYHSLQMPVYDSVAFEFDSAEQIEANFKGDYDAHVYSRVSSPTVEYFEHKLKSLTGAHAVLALYSGMSAIANTIMAIVKAGDNIISSNQLFGHTYALLKETLEQFSVETRFSNLQSGQEIEKLIDHGTRAIYFETVTNPQLHIFDIELLAAIARKYNLLLIADSTMTPPNVFQGLKYGINIEVMSTTKHISGGATSFGGAVIDYGNYNWNLNPNLDPYTERFGDLAFIKKLRKNISRNMAGTMSPQTARLQIQGLDLLELRVEKSYKNCLYLGNFLMEQPQVKAVGYPGLKTDPLHDLAVKYFSGIPGTILTFDLESKQACFNFMNRLKVIRRATNMNDNKTLIIHPHSTIYSEFDEQEKKEAGIRDTMMRLSVGIENPEDLADDMAQALKSH